MSHWKSVKVFLGILKLGPRRNNPAFLDLNKGNKIHTPRRVSLSRVFLKGMGNERLLSCTW